jgi:hypothetical protein
LTPRASRIGPRPAILPASPSRSCVVLDGEPADEPLGLPGIADGGAGKQLRGAAARLWRPASGGGGWLSGADLIDSGVREAVGRVRLGLTCVRRLVYYQI